MQTFLQQLAQIMDQKYILTHDQDKAPYLTDWRKRFTGKALAIVLPSSTAEVAKIIQLCAEHQIAIVPQGGIRAFVEAQPQTAVAIKSSLILSA